MADTENLLFEIGVEELPASYVDRALVALGDLFEKRLEQARLHHSGIQTYGTPRRLAVFVYDLATRQSNLSETVIGPAVRVAFDNEGRPTKAAVAFATKVGCHVEDLTRVDTPKGVYLSGQRFEPGRATVQVLSTILAEICAAIPFRKAMRWGEGEATFGRPVRWIVALVGGEVVDVSFAGVTSSRVTYGHRFLAPDPIELPDASDYVARLREAHVIADPVERCDLMMERLREACEERGVTLIEDEFLRMENLNLVEEPNVLVGAFDESFLALPQEVIVAVAKGHQRYFCARRDNGELAPVYLTVAGTAVRADNVRIGNDRVMRARLSDARFFFEEDLKVSLETRFGQLGGIVFQKRLGSVQDKVKRVEVLTAALCRELGHEPGFDASTTRDALRGAHLCKCDLASLMVGEFPELQGKMGAYYAQGQGETATVVAVVRGHYQPRSANDRTADNRAAAVVAIADRIDTLVGCFAIGLVPTGAADPYALRRACLGVLRTLLDHNFPIAISWLVQQSFATYEGTRLDLDLAKVQAKLGEFFRDRLRGLLAESHPHDVVDACLAAAYDTAMDVRDRVVALEQVQASVRSRAGEVFKRATNIAKQAPGGAAQDPKALGEKAHKTEIAVYEALAQLDEAVKNAQYSRDYPAAFRAIAGFAPLLEAFFADVYVMDDDPTVRDNRLRLMRSISEHCSRIAHFNLLT